MDSSLCASLDEANFMAPDQAIFISMNKETLMPAGQALAIQDTQSEYKEAVARFIRYKVAFQLQNVECSRDNYSVMNDVQHIVFFIRLQQS